MFSYLFFGLDTILVALCGLLLWRMPASPSEAPTDPLASSAAAPIVGVIAMLRGGWRAIGLVSAWSYLSSEDAGASFQTLFMATLVATLALVFVGFLTTQRTLLEKITSPSVRDTLSDLVAPCWRHRRAIAIAAVVVEVAPILMTVVR